MAGRGLHHEALYHAAIDAAFGEPKIEDQAMTEAKPLPIRPDLRTQCFDALIDSLINFDVGHDAFYLGNHPEWCAEIIKTMVPFLADAEATITSLQAENADQRQRLEDAEERCGLMADANRLAPTRRRSARSYSAVRCAGDASTNRGSRPLLCLGPPSTKSYGMNA
jgi:hypothetical protein